MKKTLVLFAHPRLEQSRVNTSLLSTIQKEDRITLHDLYEAYPNFNIDVEAEKSLLNDHDIIVWHHPLYWYSCPAILKQWIDMVLEFGWAYGPGGSALKGKIVFNTITTGGARDAYSPEGRNKHTIHEFLSPFEQTALLCGMTYLPPFAIQGTHRLDEDQIGQAALSYARLIRSLRDGTLDVSTLTGDSLLNDIIPGLTKETI